MLNQDDQDEGESITNWPENIGALPQTENPAKTTTTKPLPPAANLTEAADNIEDDISKQFSQESENIDEQQDEELGADQDQPNFETLPEIELKTRKKTDVDTDPELANLGEIRKTTRYGLRTNPTRNLKYFYTDIVIPEGRTDLRHGNTISETTQTGAIKQTASKSILKIKTAKKPLNNNIEIAYFEHLSKQAKFAVREAFKLQKLLKSPTPNRHLEDFILRGDFKSNKNTLFFQHTEDAINVYGRKKDQKLQKRVTFLEKTKEKEEKSKNVKINLTNIIKSTFFSCSLAELIWEQK